MFDEVEAYEKCGKFWTTLYIRPKIKSKFFVCIYDNNGFLKCFSERRFLRDVVISAPLETAEMSSVSAVHLKCISQVKSSLFVQQV